MYISHLSDSVGACPMGQKEKKKNQNHIWNVAAMINTLISKSAM